MELLLCFKLGKTLSLLYGSAYIGVFAYINVLHLVSLGPRIFPYVQRNFTIEKFVM